MFMRCLVLSLFSTTLAFAADPPVLPLKKSGDKLGVHVNVTKAVPVVQQVTVNVNGKNEVRTVTTLQTVVVTEFHAVTAKDGQILDRDGKEIDAKKLADVLKEGTLVALVTGTAPTAAERKALAERKAEVIFVRKAPPAKDGVPPPPPPPPPPPLLPPKQVPAPPTYTVATGGVLKDGTLTVKMNTTIFESIQVTEKRKTPDGKEVDVVVVKTVPVTKQVTVTYAVKNLIFQTPKGKPIALDDLPKLLTDKTVLVIGLTEKPLTEKEIGEVKNAAIVVLPMPKDK